ncbi:ABC transporter substrate-binding protein [Roseateles saccharophilus]|uniref:Carbohydrate ABC transporter substrate-binding protein (CUT1 family) n=1 Tax=Roseateles saccharophilus TaxID=304 RepID=A0A4R3URB9_ROSSA|nr:extracellular solute-binding protein [Roseateles saccharophilus]MDG0833215.1 extracellular solute-binding protein [Roseateles saccharophilus]TCU94436.1 carbohydrate ABC transporter substrate-binding protein (CUT1 family) [Roseateles saccharophilus]
MQDIPAITRRHLLAAAACGAAGLGRAAERPPLTVAAFPLVDVIVKDVLKGWSQSHPEVDAEVISRQYDDHHTAMTTALSTSGHLPDVIALEASYLGRFSLGAGLEDLSAPAFGAERFRERFVPFAFETARNREGHVVAMPTDIGPGSLFYRVDLLARAGLKEEDLTRSWEAYVEAGTELRARTGAYLIGDVRLLKDIVVRAGTPPGEGQFFDAQGRAQITSPRFVRAFELARKVRLQGLDARVEVWFNDWAEMLKRGRLATEISGAWMAGQMANWVAPGTAGKWRVAQLPEGAYCSYGGTYYAIPRRSAPERKQLAWQLIQELTLDRQHQLDAFKSQDAFPALLAAQQGPFFDQPLPFLGGQKARQLWREAAQRIPVVRMHRQHKFADEVVNAELDNVLEYGKPIAQALEDAQALLVHRANR